jgi:hypothetical protein
LTPSRFRFPLNLLVGQPSVEDVRRDGRIRAGAVDRLEVVERQAL